MQQDLFPNEKVPIPKPVLFFRDERGVLLIVPNTVDTINRLWVLARSHVFNVCRGDDKLVVYQGAEPQKVPKYFMRPWDILRPKVMHMGLTDKATDVCETCQFKGHCQGPEDKAPAMRPDNVVRNSLTIFAEALDSDGIDCPIFKRHEKLTVSTIMPRDLRSIGFEPISSPRAFTETLDDIGFYHRLQGVDLSDAEAVNAIMGPGWYKGVLYDGWRRDRWSMEGSKFDDVFFDVDKIYANRLLARIRGRNAARERKRNQDFRRSKCALCLYECGRPPWNMDQAGEPLTHEWIMDNFRDYDREWMEAFTVMGHKGHFINPDTGRQNMGIGCWPNKDGTVKVVRLCPGYQDIADMSMRSYLIQVMENDERKRGLGPQHLDMDDEHMTYANWALHQLLELMRHRDIRFIVDDRSKRNDILSVEMTEDLIVVGSDTLASDADGFNWRPPGTPVRRIDNWKRPRFTTEYHHPYTSSIQSWLGRAPGGCRR